MSDLFKTLLIDVGNTQIKYALVNVHSDFSGVCCCLHVEDLNVQISSAERVLVSCVGHLAKLTAIQELCKRLNKPYKVVQTEAHTLGIVCAYEKFQTLGVDRWLAVLAAREITQLPVAVIDLGTANTCDIVINNQHVGGWISPGFSVMRESLLNNTQHVFADTKMPDSINLGDTTQDCVSLGCLASQTGFVMMAEKYLSDKYENYAVLVTGGGQNSLSLAKNTKIQFFPNLVLRGLFRLI